MSKRCAHCKVTVRPATWYRLASGVLLCGRCFWETENDREAFKRLRVSRETLLRILG